MNRLTFAATLLASAMSTAAYAAAPGEDAMGELQVFTYAIELDPTGAIRRLEPTQPIAAELRQELRRHIDAWIFQPAMADGHPVATSSYLRVVARVPDQEAGAVRILSATTGPAPDELRLPEYPVRAQRRGDEGVVVLKLQLDAAGDVSDTQVYEGSPRVARELVDAATSAARNWRFLPERVDGSSVASTVLMPVCFFNGQPGPATCEWEGPESRQFNRKTVLTLDPAARVLTGLAYGAD